MSFYLLSCGAPVYSTLSIECLGDEDQNGMRTILSKSNVEEKKDE
jgi:hypothetical protein